MNKKVRGVLDALVNEKFMYGLELVKVVPSLKRGTCYITLSKMEDDGLITSELEQESEMGRYVLTPRRKYSITQLGRERNG